MRAGVREALTAVAASVVAGCRGDQSALDPAGHQAAAIAGHWWFLLVVCTAIYVAVIAVFFWSLFRGKASSAPGPEERQRRKAVALATGATVLVVFVFLIHAVWTNRILGSLPQRDAITIEVVGQQWWWSVSYKDRRDTPYLTTANEIHVPVGVPVRIELVSRDVIHSFWVPNLHGKIDLIPGVRNTLMLRADRPGVFRGQCAEFCGLQHALMGLLVIVQPGPEYERWVANQRLPSRPPRSERERRGQQLFVSSQCAVCHTIRGTMAGGTTAPDLTHLASRHTIAAASLPNRRGHLAGWIADPQSIKRGTLMPSSDFQSKDFLDLLSYLESLQ